MDYDLGTAAQAIEFALGIDDHYDMREFLDEWMHGGTGVGDWKDEYAAVLRTKQY